MRLVMSAWNLAADVPKSLRAAGNSASERNRWWTALGTDYLPWVAFGYLLLTAVICGIEVMRTRMCGPDVLTLFMAMFLLQCCLPGIVIFGFLPFTGLDQPTGNPVFDRIFAAMDLSSAMLVLGLTAWFAFLIYIFMALGAVLIRRAALHRLPSGQWLMLRASPTRLLVVLSVGLALTVLGFWHMGDSLVDRYSRLIELRAGVEAVEGDRLSNFAFSLSQTWTLLSPVALFVLSERRGRTLIWYCCLIGAGTFAVLSVSRRALFIPVLLAYFTFVLSDGRWRLKSVLAASIPILLLVAFGKEAFAAVAFGGSITEVVGRYQTVAAGAVRTACEMGITVVESLGTINLLKIPPRFGIDHLLSVMHGAPLGYFVHWLGQDSALPDRVVRMSTLAFSTPDDRDIPPGLFGQMWLDFRALGPIVWAFVFAIQLSIVQGVFSLAVRTKEAIAAIVLITFLVALPLNTGSYDFTFNDDVIALIMCLAFTFKPMRISLAVREAIKT